MSRFYVQKENVKGKEILIEGEEAHHILDVMRLEEGDGVVVFDGTGKEYIGVIREARKKQKRLLVMVKGVREKSPEALPEVTLAQALPKKGKMDYIAEKATELGVSEILPVVAARSIVRPDEKSKVKKADRWRKIVLEASKQCGRTSIPRVDEVIAFNDVRGMLSSYDMVLMACFSEEAVPMKKAISGAKPGKILVLVGPEGGFTPEEIELAKGENTKYISLGERVLKSDTAGLFALSCLNYEMAL